MSFVKPFSSAQKFLRESFALAFMGMLLVLSSAAQAGPLLQAFRNFSQWQTLQADVSIEYFANGISQRTIQSKLFSDGAGNAALIDANGSRGQWYLGDRVVLKENGVKMLDRTVTAAAGLQDAMRFLAWDLSRYGDEFLVTELGDQLAIRCFPTANAPAVKMTVQSSGRISAIALGDTALSNLSYAISGSTQILAGFTVTEAPLIIPFLNSKHSRSQRVYKVVLTNVVIDQALPAGCFNAP